MFQDVVPHDGVVSVRVDADIPPPGEAEAHYVAEYSVDIRQACNAVDDMVG